MTGLTTENRGSITDGSEKLFSVFRLSGPTCPNIQWAITYLLIYLCTYLVLTYVITYVLTYLLTPWSRVLLEKLTGFQPVKKFPTFYGTRRFIPAYTSVRHLSLS